MISLVWTACSDSPSSPSSTPSPPPVTVTPEACFTVEPEGHVFAARQSITLDASCSQNTTDATSYTWQLGDGRTETGRKIEVEYSRPGDYVIELDVSNGDETSKMQLKVRINPRPVACFEWEQIPGTPPAPCTVRFDASCSTGSLEKYEWFFQGGPFPPDSLPDVTETTKEPTILYSWAEDEACFAFRPFGRIVRLTVTDESGVTNTYEDTIQFHTPFFRD